MNQKAIRHVDMEMGVRVGGSREIGWLKRCAGRLSHHEVDEQNLLCGGRIPGLDGAHEEVQALAAFLPRLEGRRVNRQTPFPWQRIHDLGVLGAKEGFEVINRDGLFLECEDVT